VMELVDGVTLARALPAGATMPWPQAVRLCAQVAAALAAAHAHGIVHRDITPTNIMLTGDGVKVVDFGISAVMGEAEPDDEEELLGTAAYLSPERLTAAEVAPPADVYALGLVLCRCLTGTLPWNTDNPTHALYAHLHTPPAPLPPIDGLPEPVIDMYERCLAKDPADRPTSVEVARVLGAAVAGFPATAAAPVGLDTEGREPHTTMLPYQVGRARVAAPATGPTGTRPLSAAAGPPPRSRRVLASLGVLALVAGGAMVAAIHGSTTGTQTDAMPQPKACLVTYAESLEGPDRFRAWLTVQAAGSGPGGWQLAFTLPAGRQVDEGSSPTLPLWVSQQGAGVTVRSTDTPAAGQIEVQLTGTGPGTTQPPMDFTLSGQPCQSLAATAAPAGSPAASVPPGHDQAASPNGKGPGKDRPGKPGKPQ
jgi:eukaryotic-like serine/threonine-protein kinase